MTADSIAIERAALRQLVMVYDQINDVYFRRQLERPVFAFTDSKRTLGRWMASTRSIELGRALLSGVWGQLVEVLKHEMAHQFVDEILGARGEPPHGPSFRGVCERLGIDPAAEGMPEPPTEGSGAEKVTARVQALLALAESPNQHEAESAARAASRLMLRHNIDRVGQGKPSGYAFRHLGKPTGRVDEHLRLLAALLGRHFFVEVIWVPVWRALEQKRGSVLEICGTWDNIEIASYVYDFMLHTAARLWVAHKADTRSTSNRDRRRFLSGVMAGFADQLARDRVRESRTGLVWVGDPSLDRFFKARHPHVRNVRYAGQSRNDAFSAGREQGRQVRLRRGVGGKASGAIRLLGSGR